MHLEARQYVRQCAIQPEVQLQLETFQGRSFPDRWSREAKT